MCHQRSSMVELLSILRDIFSKEPPVTSRQHAHNPPQQSSTPPGLPLRPFEHPWEPRQSSTSSTTQRIPPPPPPKQQLQAEADELAGTRASPLGRYDAPPPLPDTVRPASQALPSIQASTQGPSAQFTPQRSTSLGQPMIPPHPQEPQSFAQPRHSQAGSDIRFSTAPVGTPSQTAQPVTLPAQGQYPRPHSSITQSAPPNQNISLDQPHTRPTTLKPPTHWQQGQSVTNLYRQESVHPRPLPQPKPHVNLLDSPFDINFPASSSVDIPAPPIPPTPEKDALLSGLSQSITQTLHNDMLKNAASLPLLRSQNEALNNSFHTLESELAQLQALHGPLTSNISILQSSLREADQCISSAHARARRGEIPKIDEMLTAPTVVGKQLYDVVCDERGIDAAIWALQAALTRGRISTDVWAKKTRELSREGFKKKVLTRKIASGMGLEE